MTTKKIETIQFVKTKGTYEDYEKFVKLFHKLGIYARKCYTHDMGLMGLQTHVYKLGANKFLNQKKRKGGKTK